MEIAKVIALFIGLGVLSIIAAAFVIALIALLVLAVASPVILIVWLVITHL